MTAAMPVSRHLSNAQASMDPVPSGAGVLCLNTMPAIERVELVSPVLPGKSRWESYTNYLQSGHWMALKRLKFEQCGKGCFNCSSSLIPCVHHINYKNLIDCTLSDLMVLCKACHEDLHLAAKVNHLKLEGIREAEACEIIRQFRTTERWAKRQKRLSKRLNNGSEIKRLHPKSVLKAAMRTCQKEGYNRASIENLILQCNRILEQYQRKAGYHRRTEDPF